MEKVIEKILKSLISISLMVISYYSAHASQNIILLPNQIAGIVFFCTGVAFFLITKKSKFELLIDQLISYITLFTGCAILYDLFNDKSVLPNLSPIFTSLMLLGLLSALISVLEKHAKDIGVYMYIGFFLGGVVLLLSLLFTKVGVFWLTLISILISLVFEIYGYVKKQKNMNLLNQNNPNNMTGSL